MLERLRFTQSGRTFYRPEQPVLERVRLVAEDDAGQVQVGLRGAHVRVAGLRYGETS